MSPSISRDESCLKPANLSAILFGLITLLFLIPLVSAQPTIEFLPPTPAPFTADLDYTVKVNSTADTTTHYTFLVKDEDLLLWYRFENTTINSATGEYDWSGNGYHGLTTADVTPSTDGKFNNSIQIDGDATNRGDVRPPADFNNYNFGINENASFTFALWARFTDTSAIETIFDFNREGSSGVAIREGGGNVRLYYGNGTNVINEVLGIGSRESIVNQWHHYVVTYNGSTLQVFFDGNSQWSKVEPNMNANINASVAGENSIGCRGTSTYNCLNGTIDEFLAFSRPFTEAEAKSLYNATANQFEVGYTLSGENDTIRAYAVDENALFSVTSDIIVRQGGGEFTISWPNTNQTFQRNNATDGLVTIKGDVTGVFSGNFSYSYIGAINGSLGGGPPTQIPEENTMFDSPFTINFTLPVGAWDVTIYDAEDNSTNYTLNNIRVGDIYLITGQSNANGFSQHSFPENPDNPYKVYRWTTNTNEWVAGATGAYWPVLFDNITQTHDIPIAYVKTALGSTIDMWLENGSFWNATVNNYTLAMNGTSFVVGPILFYQGESNTFTAEEDMKGNYSLFADQILAFYNSSIDGIIMAQINVVPNREEFLFRVRRPQQQLWDEQANILRGPVTYDINLSQDGLHYRTFDESTAIGERWINCVDRWVYGGTSGCEATNITDVSVYEGGIMRVTFNRDLIISEWNKTTSTNAKGFRFTRDGENPINNTNGITSITLVSSKVAQITFDTALNDTWNMSIGRAADGNDQYILRDAIDNRPVEIVWDYPVNMSELSAFPVGDSCDIASAVTPIFILFVLVLIVLGVGILIWTQFGDNLNLNNKEIFSGGITSLVTGLVVVLIFLLILGLILGVTDSILNSCVLNS